MKLGLCASLLAPSNTTDWVSCNVFAAEHLRNGEEVCSCAALGKKLLVEIRPRSKTTQLKLKRKSCVFGVFRAF